MTTNPLKKLEVLGQSIWLDYIKRDLFTSGQLKKLITEDGLGGMTSNPSLFEKAITQGNDYEEQIKTLLHENVTQVYEALALKDVQTAADTFRDLYDHTQGQDGYVSLEVNPHLAHDTNGTITEARRLWKALDRPMCLLRCRQRKKACLPFNN